ncbi:MAG: undecaprenyl diphosphate synthase family protein [Candidatus Woesearchaeota archaeon]
MCVSQINIASGKNFFFLIWQSHYSEWFFLEKMWPEFEKEDILKVIDEFRKRERRFGK